MQKKTKDIKHGTKYQKKANLKLKISKAIWQYAKKQITNVAKNIYRYSHKLKDTCNLR